MILRSGCGLAWVSTMAECSLVSLRQVGQGVCSASKVIPDGLLRRAIIRDCEGRQADETRRWEVGQASKEINLAGTRILNTKKRI